MLRLLGGLVVTVMTVYAPPKRRTGKGEEREGSGLYPELAVYRISEGCSPNVQEEVGRAVAQMPMRLAQEELARRGIALDEKAVARISEQLGRQMLARRTHELLLFREGELEAGGEFAGKRIAVQIDGGRVRIRKVVKKSRVGKTRKRRKYKVEWREPKVVTIFLLDDQGRMEPKSKAVIDGTLRGPDALIELVAFHLHRLGAAQAREVVFLGDGAKWIWNRLDWVIEKASLKPERVFQVLDWCHCVHHLSLALEDARLRKDNRNERYTRLRKLLKQGKAEAVIEELETLAVGRSEDSVIRREIRYLQRHADADRLRYAVFRFRKQPIGSGAIESTIRRVINLRLKGNSIYWTEENAEAIFQLRAALLSGRWEEQINATRDYVGRTRNTDWQWTPPAALAELKALEADDDEDDQLPSCKQVTARAA